jgi:hypothetical protein
MEMYLDRVNIKGYRNAKRRKMSTFKDNSRFVFPVENGLRANFSKRDAVFSIYLVSHIAREIAE